VVPVSAYLARIGYSGPTSPAFEALRDIHRAHLFSVPFENLDIALGRKIVVDEEGTLRKIVELRRGGFCYELNGALAALLRALGFQVTLLSARATGKGGHEGPEFDHLTLRVDLSESYLADVGFGDSFLEPLRLDLNGEQSDPAGTFRIVSSGERLQLEKFDAEKGWRRQYSFTLEPRHIEEFAGMCHYHQTSPKSHFTQNSICTRATPEGRITLSGMKFIVTRNRQREERMLSSEQERADLLRAQFGIVR
jgi:N-hydroxyarylamine O-acetyltransferase